jgi:alkylation response protein AidB-like acyl-CoA dehydrogenase
MNYDEATGWLVGEENKGLKIMFVMMNEARLGVGLQGLGLAETAYQYSLAFAKDRIQGRSLTGPKNPDGPADPIIVHPDVRRMLMDQKVFVEGARAFTYWTALQGDLEHKATDEAVREKAGDFMALLTPIVKAYLTDKGYESVSTGLQIHGGSGFTREWGIEQLLRDARITLIYEGTNGVQALDLVGRHGRHASDQLLLRRAGRFHRREPGRRRPQALCGRPGGRQSQAPESHQLAGREGP